MKRTILMLALDKFTDSGQGSLGYSIDSVSEYIRNFNAFGYRVLLATSDGSKLLEHEELTGNNDEPVFNFPLPVTALSIEDLTNMCGVYILSSKDLTWNDLSNASEIEWLLSHFMKQNKVVAVQNPSHSQVLCPHVEDKMWCPDLDDEGYANPNVTAREFSQSVMNLIALQYIA